MNKSVVIKRIPGLDHTSLAIIESNFDIIGMEDNLLVTALKEDNSKMCTIGILSLIELSISQILEEQIPECNTNLAKEKLYEMVRTLANTYERIKTLSSDKDKIKEYNQFVINHRVPGPLRYFVNNENLFPANESLEHYNNDYSILPEIPELKDILNNEYYSNREEDSADENPCKECACGCQCNSKKEETTVQQDIRALNQIIDDLAELSSKIGEIGSRLIDRMNNLNV